MKRRTVLKAFTGMTAAGFSVFGTALSGTAMRCFSNALHASSESSLLDLQVALQQCQRACAAAAKCELPYGSAVDLLNNADRLCSAGIWLMKQHGPPNVPPAFWQACADACLRAKDSCSRSSGAIRSSRLAAILQQTADAAHGQIRS